MQEADVEFVSKLVFDEGELAAFRKDMHDYNQGELTSSVKHLKESMLEVMMAEDDQSPDQSYNDNGPTVPIEDDFAVSTDDELLGMPGAWS